MILYKWQLPGALRSGMVLTVKTIDELTKEFGSLDGVPGGFTTAMRIYCGHKFRVTPEVKDRIVKTNEFISIRLFQKDGFCFSAAMLKPNKKELCERVEDTIVIGGVGDFDKAIIEEMLSKVDFDMARKMIAHGTWENASPEEIPMDYVKKMLTNWAINKKWLYLLMGRNLSVKKTFQVNKTEREMETLIDDFVSEFPVYGFHVRQFSTREILDNKIHRVPSLYSKYCDICRTGMKVSKFFSQLLNDDMFDIALSKIMQNTKIDAVIEISIDPMDYFTMSITKHKWVSCFDIGKGSFSNCAFSIMQDAFTAIAFKHNDKKHDYTLKVRGGNFQFQWNSKQCRSAVCFDEASKSIMGFRGQGSPDSSYYDAVDAVAKEIIGGTDVEYTKIDRYSSTYYQNNSWHYTPKESRYGHVHDDAQHILIPNDVDRDTIEIKMGVPELKNPLNGSVIHRSSKLW